MIVGIVGYVFLFRETEESALNKINETNTPGPVSSASAVNWQSLISEIREVIGPNFFDVKIEEFSPLAISEEKDITGDGVKEAFIDLGSGGAYTGYLALMKIEDSRPVLAQFRQEDGTISPVLFLEGASVMNGEAVEMLSEKNAIYSGHWSKSIDGEPFGSLTDCDAEAYQWNEQLKVFEFSKILSLEIRPEFCQKAISNQ